MSCLPAASHRNAMVLLSGDQAWSVGYLISEMRSIVMLPFGSVARSNMENAIRVKVKADTFTIIGIFIDDPPYLLDRNVNVTYCAKRRETQRKELAYARGGYSLWKLVAC